MKAITVHQPFAEYLANRNKHYETRSWHTPYRGLVAIHAGKTWNDDLKSQARLMSNRYKDLPHVHSPALGAVLAIGILEAIYSAASVREQLDQTERAIGNYADSRFAWKIRIIERFEKPISASGQQNLWEWDFPEAIAKKRIAIVGSHKYPNLDYIVKYVNSLPLDTVI